MISSPLLARSSGSRQPRSSALRISVADSAVSRPHASFGGEEFYPTIEQKAATLLFGIARNHAFVDGNKRVAVLATLQFLNRNGRDLDLTPPEKAYEIIAGTAAGTVTDHVGRWKTPCGPAL